MATGELDKNEIKRKTERDSRTLYVRFKSSGPNDEAEIYKLDTNIKLVRCPRQGKKSKENKKEIKYCFVEFSDEAACEAAKDKLASNPDHFVDFVGVKSKGHTNGTKSKNMPINPTRLHVSGLVEGITEEKLKSLFPKCVSSLIPKNSVRKGGKYGFVQFSSPADAKAAFDAANKLKIESSEGATHLTVVFARVSKHGPNNSESPPKKKNQNKKGKKRQSDKTDDSAKKTKLEEKVEKNKNEDESSEETEDENNDKLTENNENCEAVNKETESDIEKVSDELAKKDESDGDESESEGDDETDGEEVENDQDDDENDSEDVENDKDDDDEDQDE